MQEAAVEAAAGVGEADLRRLKRQFSSLKNTFLHYEVKNEFLAGAGCMLLMLVAAILVLNCAAAPPCRCRLALPPCVRASH